MAWLIQSHYQSGHDAMCLLNVIFFALDLIGQ